MLFRLLRILDLSIGLTAVIQPVQGKPNRNPEIDPCHPLGPYKGEFETIHPVPYSITANGGHSCTPYIALGEVNYCGVQQLQAYAYLPGTTTEVKSEYISIWDENGRLPLAEGPGASLYKVFHTGAHVRGNIMACAVLTGNMEADLYLRVIYWPAS